ncbi:cholesterol transport system auxiliary component [Pseudorhodobacter antarcticus]|jgi:cholesterol transport system auxiliary component|uniref:Cholesterol transport system auxiliary component n=1 Tax=Pseudorhodobacter antarcticus TaxID=1077947 RepID=A0A1H8LRF8_9RHOB|nr:ABC-type transport auxiliary lipoprotein family protein [Pseudorhodobacter antarcticus]SEO07436.1 cholesterol transport system auxiliary component [Pseudorhodobacter antarcticus]
MTRATTQKTTLLLALATAALLPGCSALSALSGAATPLSDYDLNAPATPVQARTTSSRQLVVELPTAPGALTTDRILIRPHPLQAAYLPDGKWAEETPTMLQTLMVRSFEDANAFRYVGRRPLGSMGDYALLTELTDFQAEAAADGQTATIRLRLTARLVREEDASVIASRSFTQTTPVPSTQALALVEGFNTANQAMLADLTIWVLDAAKISIKR